MDKYCDFEPAGPFDTSAGAEIWVQYEELGIPSAASPADGTEFEGFHGDASAPSLGTTIEGITFDEDASNAGFYHIPPDPHGAVGPSHVVSIVNTSIEWHTKTGTQQNSQRLGRNSSTAVGSFFETLSPVNGLFDPKVIYDQHNGRFVVVALERTDTARGDATNTSRILVAVSDNNDPNGTWYYTAINSKLTINSVDTWADYPGFAVGTDAVYITNNMFSFGSPSFQGSRLWIIDKSAFYSGGTASIGVYDPSTAAALSGQSFTLQPAHMYGTPPGGTGTFLVSTNWTSGSDEFASVIRVDNPLGSPTFSNQFVSFGDISSGSVPAVPQSGTSQTIDGGDSRAMNAVWRNNRLWAANTINPSSGTDSGQATAHWFQINTTTLGSLALADQGNVGGESIAASTHTFYPAITVDSAGNMGLGFAASAASIFPGAYYTGRLAADTAGATQDPSALAAGQAYYYRAFGGSRNRWGDYSGISLDPTDETTFWVFNEYALTRGTVLGSYPSEDGRWGTRWGSYSLAAFPTVTARDPAPGATIGTSSVNIDVTFSEAVQGVDATDLVLTGTAAASASKGTVTNTSGNTWRFPVSGLADGTLNVSLAPDANDIEDLAGNDLANVTWSYTVTLGVSTFVNNSTISIPSSGAASPYPSTINVAGLTGVITDVNVSLSGVTHTWPDDIDVLLVGPGGQKVILMSDVGGSDGVSGVTLTLDDAASNSLPDSTALGTGTFKPTNIGTGDTFSSPAPASPYGSLLSDFNGTDPNGTWSLYVTDDESGDSGSVATGWSITIGFASPTNATLAIAATDASKAEGNSGNTAFTFTVTRGGDTTSATDVNYAVTGSGANPANATDFGGTFPSGAVNFANNETSKVITVNVSGDTTVEPSEGFTVTLSNATGGATIVTSAASGAIQNDDRSLAIVPANANQAEGNSGNRSFTFSVTRTGDLSVATNVDYAVTGAGSSPANAADFGGTFPSGTLSFAVNEGSKQIALNVSGDTTVEPDESFMVTLSNASANASITMATGMGTIRDDDEIEWLSQGPGPSQNGQVENITNKEVVGAVHTVLAHPTNADILYLGSTNGGVWKTTNATAPSPSWTPLTDAFPSLSIGALAFDPTDASRQTVVAGIGRYSSYYRFGGQRAGILRSADAGANWTLVDGGGTLAGKNISGIAARGNTIVVSVNIADAFTYANIGIFRSTNGGTSFTQISSGNGSSTGLPGGVSYDLAADPSDNAVLYTSMVFADGVGGQNGIYKSTDTGATWTKVSNSTIDGLISNNTSNIEIVVGNSNNVYATIINNGNPVGIFRSGNGGGTWTQMDTPKTNENGTDVGLNPRGIKGPGPGAAPEEIAGGQGAIHFSMVADPSNPNIVYVGGDRQPTSFGDTGFFPNSIGAMDYSGRLFRGDASQPLGSQWVHLTHSNSLGAVGGGTASSSSPHADSREMTFDANGNIIEVDDGGIYRRTSPTNNTGDWFSLIGDLQTTEIHDVAYDPIANVLMSGNQDTGSTEQITPGSSTWRSISTGDGGDVAVDSITLAASNRSIRYSSFQNLGGFRRRVVDVDNNVVSTSFPALTVTGGGAAMVKQFKTPVELNHLTPSRIIIVGNNSIYESLDQGDTLTEVGPSMGPNGSATDQDAVDYGGYKNNVANPDVLYLGVDDKLRIRTTSGGSLVSTDPNTSSADDIRDVVMDPSNWESAFTIDSTRVYQTTNAGGSWTDITGNLMSLAGSFIRTVEFVPGPVGALLVGGSLGVFRSLLTSLGAWTEVGAGLPNAPVWDLEYDPQDDVLAAGTLGRGAWTVNNASDVLANGTSVAIAATDAAKSEGNTASTSFTFTVNRTGDTIVATSVNYAVTGSGANPADASDFGGVFPSGSVNFAVNETSKVININVSGETAIELDEGFTVTLSSATGGATITTTTASGNILNDDVPPKVAGIYVRGSGWNSNYLNMLAANNLGSATAGYLLRDGSTQIANASSVTWAVIDQISVTFTEAVTVGANSLRLLNSANQDVALASNGFSYDSGTNTARWTLAAPLTRDKLLIALDADAILDSGGAALDGEWTTSVTTFATSGNGAAGGDMYFRFNYLPGDVTLNGQTNTSDIGVVRGVGTAIPNSGNFRYDVTANNLINTSDVGVIRGWGTLTLAGLAEPTIPPPPPGGSPLLAPSTGGNAGSAVLDERGLTPVVTQALALWSATGLDPATQVALAGVQFSVVDLGPGPYLGMSYPGRIELDDDAAGWGWFVDPSPAEHREFSRQAGTNSWQAAPGSPAVNRMDLLTVVLHELGHQLGMAHRDGHNHVGSDLMDAALVAGTRLLPEHLDRFYEGLGDITPKSREHHPLFPASTEQREGSAATANSSPVLAPRVDAIRALPVNVALVPANGGTNGRVRPVVDRKRPHFWDADRARLEEDSPDSLDTDRIP